MSPAEVEVQQRDRKLPEGWERIRFGEIYELAYGKSLTKTARNTDGQYPVYGSNGIVGHHDAFLVKGPALVVGRKGAAGAVSFSTKPCWPIDTTYYIRDSEHIDIRFSFYLLTSLRLNQFDRSTAIPGLNRDDAYDLVVRLPPYQEQHRIVAKIEELFSELAKGVESLKTAREQLKVYRQSILKHAFEGKLTAQWRAQNADQLQSSESLLARIRQAHEDQQHKQLTDWKTTVRQWEANGKEGKKPKKPRELKSVAMLAEEEVDCLEELPSSWQWLPAESVGIIQLGRQRSPKNRSRNYPTKYIRAANITEQGLDLGDVLDMDFGPHELSAYRLGKGDLVLSEASGSAAQVGKPAIWDDQIPNCCFQNTVIRHQPYCRDHAAYLLWLYRFFYVTGKFARVAGGVGINHLSAYKFAQIALPVCPFLEQQEIVRLLEGKFTSIEQNEREIDSALKRAELLRQAILKKAFAGQLVAQDPDDEPASVLLYRIKVEKEQISKKAGTTRKTRRKRTSA